MTDINLLESVQGKNNQQKGIISYKSFVIPAIILIGIFAIYGAGIFYSSYLAGQKSKIDQENLAEMANLSGKNVDRITDFQDRMDLASSETAIKDDYDTHLKELENSMINGASVDSFKYSGGTAEINIVTDNFKTMARQILSFKNSKDFGGLQIGAVSRDKDGKITFSLKK